MNQKIISSIILKFFARRVIVLPFYHVVSDVEVPHVKYLYRVKNIKEFKNDLEFLLNFFKPISFEDLYNFLYIEKKIPSNSFVLSFDDGYKECYEVIAPILREKGIPACFFINANFIDNKELFYRCKLSLILQRLESIRDLTSKAIKNIKEILCVKNSSELKKELYKIDYRKKHLLDSIAEEIDLDFLEYLNKIKPYLTTDRIRELINDGFYLGAHSLDHPSFELLKLDEQIRQTKESIKYLKNNFNIRYSFFSFPFNSKGITKEYLLIAKDFVDIFFGTGGIGWSKKNCFFDRLPMELTINNPEKIFRKYYGQYLYQKYFKLKTLKDVLE